MLLRVDVTVRAKTSARAQVDHLIFSSSVLVLVWCAVRCARAVAAGLGVTEAVLTHSTDVHGRDLHAAVTSVDGRPFFVIVSVVLALGETIVFGAYTRASVSVPASGFKWFTDAGSAVVSVQCAGRAGGLRVARVVEPEYAVLCWADGRLQFGGDIGILSDSDVQSWYPASDGLYADISSGEDIFVGPEHHNKLLPSKVIEFWALTFSA